MARYAAPIGGTRYLFTDLREVMAKATPPKAGDRLAGIAATSAEERVAARTVLADVPLRRFLEEPLVPYDEDEVTRLVLDGHDAAAFAPVSDLTVGELREWLLAYETGPEALAAVAPGLTPEMAAAVSKLMRNQDLVLAARKCRVVTRFRSTVGLPGRLSVRLQPNHPTDDPAGIAAAILDGLLYGCGDAVIGINPATDSVAAVERLLGLTADLVERHAVPTQTCVLAHVTTSLRVLERHAPLDLVFQSVGGTEGTNRSFGFTLAHLAEARDAALALGRGARDGRVMYFETGQGSALSAGAAHGVDQQTCEARAYAVCRRFDPFLVNTVVGFIGPEYLYDGKEIVRAGLEDHFCGKLLGLPMGVDVCYTNHAEADQDDMDVLLTLLGAAGCSYVMGVPGADDPMLGYQSTSFHDAQYLRQVLGLRPAPEFERWLVEAGVMDEELRLRPIDRRHRLLGAPGGVESRRAPLGGEHGRRVSFPGRREDPWADLRARTPARIALGRAGGSLPTRELLAFSAAHAAAKDAVWAALDPDALARELAPLGLPAVVARSAAPDRAAYLQRPDLGRRLAPESEAALRAAAPAGGCDVVLVLADGLSAVAAARHGPAVLAALVPRLRAAGLRVGPVCLATQARVALEDPAGAALGARLAVILLGERPGLGAPDSLGAYLVHGPRPGRTDAERNCVSNVRPEGLPPAGAAELVAWLAMEALRRGLSGVALKDERGLPAGADGVPPVLPRSPRA